MAEFVVAHILDNYCVGDRFTLWPLHVTVLPPFEAPEADEVKSMLESTAGNETAIDLRLGDKDVFGPGLPVRRLVSNSKLQNLHLKLLQSVEASGWKMIGRYNGSHYSPHITEKSGQHYNRKEFTMDSLVVVENIGQGYRVIRARVGLETGQA